MAEGARAVQYLRSVEGVLFNSFPMQRCIARASRGGEGSSACQCHSTSSRRSSSSPEEMTQLFVLRGSEKKLRPIECSLRPDGGIREALFLFFLTTAPKCPFSGKQKFLTVFPIMFLSGLCLSLAYKRRGLGVQYSAVLS